MDFEGNFLNAEQDLSETEANCPVRIFLPRRRGEISEAFDSDPALHLKMNEHCQQYLQQHSAKNRTAAGIRPTLSTLMGLSKSSAM